ncbi:ABC transporter permease [Actinocorallia sp. API 0066]|uniref:ABC transporter permease n=1 Tax=Actinocorallia sp. API 0066 TaxID=2896846 RepID=UPI001E6000CF|nr:ABC transporter permease [Actinocorallia sp. API 0066]MCD0449746.1 ABC transporter permease [Actinocorallia sp. API 0066]
MRSFAVHCGRRVLGAAATVLVASAAVYGSLRLMPGDPVLAVSGASRLSPDQIEALRQRYGLDQGVVTGYLDWLGHALRLDLGTSLSFQTEVGTLVSARLGVSGLLIAYAAILALVLGLGTALVSAVRGGLADRIATAAAAVATATPSFVAAIILLAVFAVGLGWFPATGAGSGFADRLWHLTLPAVAMAIAVFGVLARVGHAALRAELDREHVEAARGRGVGGAALIARHVVRNALAPLVTVIGVMVASLFVGTAVVETAFGLDGVGSLLITAVSRRDFPVVQGIALIAVLLFVVVNTVVDLVLPLLDPRTARGVKA